MSAVISLFQQEKHLSTTLRFFWMDQWAICPLHYVYSMAQSGGGMEEECLSIILPCAQEHRSDKRGLHAQISFYLYIKMDVYRGRYVCDTFLLVVHLSMAASREMRQAPNISPKKRN